MVFVKGKGWTHESELKPGDQYRLKGGGWETVMPERVIGTTHEHPFYSQERGWTPAGELRPGELIRTEDGWVFVKSVTETGRVETVYNLRVEDYHTYFVGASEWGFAVWAHNANYPTDAAGVQQLADCLAAAGVKPMQGLCKMRKVDIEQIAAAMAKDSDAFWAGVSPFKKVIIGPSGEVMDGHHRVIASVLSGKAIPESQIFRFPGTNMRPVFNWIDV